MKKTSLKKIESKGKTVWVTRVQDSKNTSLKKKREDAYESLLEAINNDTDFDTLLEIAEDFGKQTFKDQITETTQDWTMEDWIDPVVEKIFNPMGAAGTFTKIADDEIHSLVFRCPSTQESWSSCLFSYGFTRGLVKSVFPQGEVLMGKTMSNGAPMCEFIFKAKPTPEEKTKSKEMKKQWTKRYHTLMKQK